MLLRRLWLLLLMVLLPAALLLTATPVVQECMRVARDERQSLSCTLHVAETNAAALAVYLSLGFSQDGLLPDYYGPGRAALRLACNLGELGSG